MLIPNPILFGPTPPGGAVLAVTSERGGLAGYVVLGQAGPDMPAHWFWTARPTKRPARLPPTAPTANVYELTLTGTLSRLLRCTRTGTPGSVGGDIF